jgi:hypothetical protein
MFFSLIRDYEKFREIRDLNNKINALISQLYRNNHLAEKAFFNQINSQELYNIMVNENNDLISYIQKKEVSNGEK